MKRFIILSLLMLSFVFINQTSFAGQSGSGMCHNGDNYHAGPSFGCSSSPGIVHVVESVVSSGAAAQVSAQDHLREEQLSREQEDARRDAEYKKTADDALDALNRMKEEESNNTSSSTSLKKIDAKEDRMLRIIRNPRILVRFKRQIAITILIHNPYNQEVISFLKDQAGLSDDQIKYICEKSPYYEA